MLRVAVAEDEYYSREVLLKLLRELPLEIEICGAFETGKQLVEFMKTTRVDLVITDIRMPEMDGLEVAKYIAEHHPNTDVMIESGYMDFDYAKKAIVHGVKSYLTKPLKPDELREAMEAVREARERTEKSVEDQVNQLLLQTSCQYLTITDMIKDKELLQKFEAECEGNFETNSYRLFLLEGAGTSPEGVADEVCWEIREKLKRSPAFVFYFSLPDEIIIVYFSEPEKERKDCIAVDNLIKECALQRGIVLTGGCSQTCRGIDQLESAYKDCIYAINRRILEGEGCLYEYEKELNLSTLMTREAELALYESIVRCDYKQAALVVEKFFHHCEEEKVSIYSFYSGIMQIFLSISRAYYQKERLNEQEISGEYFLFSFRSDLYHYRTLEQLKDYIMGILKNTCEVQEVNSEKHIIEEIKNYVRLNYQSEISLGELATHKYFMNSSYLSRLFKAETGMNFTKYLIQFRMNKAADLLLNTIFKVTEIAGYVGYNDTSYFIQTFKKYYGITPDQYRCGKDEG